MFSLSGTEAYKKWKGIRDRFKREKNLLISKKKSGSGVDDDSATLPKWKIYPILLGFLDAFTEQRQSTTNMDLEMSETMYGGDASTEDEKSQGEQASEIFHQIMDPSDIYGDLSEDENDECTKRIIAADIAEKNFTSAQNSTKPNLNSSKKRKLEDLDRKLSEVLKETTSSLSNLVNKQGPKDDIFHFFISSMGRFRKLNAKNQREFRLKTENLFYELEEEQDK